MVDSVDPNFWRLKVTEQAAEIRRTLYEKKKTLLSERQLSQLCQSIDLVARNEEELIQRLHDGYKLVQPLNHDKYLLERIMS